MSMARNRIYHVADYFPYGKILREFVESGEERFLTTQHERDRETGLDYRGARCYDSDVARFLSLDPMVKRYLDHSSYHYVLGNPTRYIDPTGKSSESTGEESTGWTANHVYLNEVFGDTYGFNSAINTSISKGNGKYVLGIHSNVSPDAGITDGHAWLSITTPDGVITTYGLWPDDHANYAGQDPNGTKTDIRVDAELDQMRLNTTYHRYTDISEKQYKQFMSLVDKYVEWGYTYTCASWASDTYYTITNRDIDADDEWALGAETPRELSGSIKEANGGKRTNRTIENEIKVKGNNESSNSYSY